MRSETFISTLSAYGKEEKKFEKMRQVLPLGEDAVGNIAYAHKNAVVCVSRLTCVTGGLKTAFIHRLLITASCLYDKSEICFFVISPNND